MEISSIERRMGVVGKEARTCETHGEYVSNLIRRAGKERWAGCPKCAQEREDAERAREVEDIRQRAEIKRVEAMMGHAALPPRFFDKTFDTYQPAEGNQKQAKYLAGCRQYAETFPERRAACTNLIMMGDPGTGKTHLAAAIARVVIEHHQMPAVYTTAARMFRRLKDTYRSDAETESQVIRAYASPALLVIDEIGLSYGSDTEMNMLFDVLNDRYEHMRPTVIVTNIKQPEELAKWLGDRVMDRLRESRIVMLFDWESERQRLGRESNG